MHRSSVTTITFFLIAALIMLVPFANTPNLFSNPAMAQGYNANNNDNNYYDDNDMFSKYPLM